MEQHLPVLISDLAVILVAAGIITVLCQRFRQPMVLGYIIAGFLVSPHVSFLPTIVDTEGVKVWADIGVIFLLFALGLEFSFKKLLRVGGAASITASIEILSMVGLGYATGRLLGWAPMDCVFLGGILAISSTTIILRAFDEAGVKKQSFVNLVFGILVMEDLGAILLLVLLSTIAISRSFQGVTLAIAVARLGFFLTLWFVTGLFLIPLLLRKLKIFMNDETLLIVSIGLCFLMVLLATQVGFSPALGAFVMGSIFAETTESSRIEHLIQPLKNLFAAIFFVSVGTLIDPAQLYAYAGPVLLITLVTIVGKTLSTLIGSLIAGQPLRHSVRAGMSLAQIGEFSFIIAGLGLTLQVTSDFLYPLAVGVCALTTFTTPFMIRSSDLVATFIETRLPANWKRALEDFQTSAAKAEVLSEWRKHLRGLIARVALNAVIIAAIFLACVRFLPTITRDPELTSLIQLLVALIFSTPFFWAWIFSETRGKRAHPSIYLRIARMLSAFVAAFVLSRQIVSTSVAIATIAAWSLIVLMLFSRFWRAAYLRLERRFFAGIDEPLGIEKARPWNPPVTRLRVSPQSPAVGLTLMACGIREKFGVTIAMIERGAEIIAAPSGHDHLYALDELAVMGADEKIRRFRSFIETDTETDVPQ